MGIGLGPVAATAPARCLCWKNVGDEQYNGHHENRGIRDVGSCYGHDQHYAFRSDLFMGISRIWLPALVLLLIGSGCAVLKPTATDAGTTTSSQWEATTDGTPQTTSSAVEGPLSLNEAIHVALANNPELAAVKHETIATGLQRDIVTGQRLPTLHFVTGYNHYLNSRRLLAARENGEAGVFSRNILASDVVLTMPLFTGGRITSEIKASELLQKAAEHHLARTGEELVFNISSLFYTILAQRRVIESLEFSEKTLQEHLRRVRELINARKAAGVDRLRTEVRVADLEQLLVRERNILAIQIRMFTKILGLDHPDKSVVPLGTLAFNKITVPETDQALSEAFENRSDYLAALKALEAQTETVDAARAERWPNIFLSGAYGGRWAADPLDEPAGTDSVIDEGQIGVVVDVPLFEGGRISSRIQLEKVRMQAARERLRRLELQVRLDVETALLNIESATKREAATRKAIEQARESLRIERQKYELGAGTITDVLDAQSALLDAQTNYYRTLADYKISVAQYHLMIGNKQ